MVRRIRNSYASGFKIVTIVNGGLSAPELFAFIVDDMNANTKSVSAVSVIFIRIYHFSLTHTPYEFITPRALSRTSIKSPDFKFQIKDSSCSAIFKNEEPPK